MKRIILILIAIITLAGCSKEAPKRYTFIYDAEVFEDVHIYLEEYDDSDRCVAINEIEHLRTGHKEDFRSSPYAECVVVRIDMDGEYIQSTLYVSNIFYLTNKKTTIRIDGKTQIQKNKPL